MVLQSKSQRYSNVYSVQSGHQPEESRPSQSTAQFVCSHKWQPNKANSYSKGNSRVSHYGCTYIQDGHMAFSCIAFPLNTRSSHAQKPDIWLEKQRQLMYSCTEGWTHASIKKTCWRRTLWLFLSKDNVQLDWMAVDMSSLKKKEKTAKWESIKWGYGYLR